MTVALCLEPPQVTLELADAASHFLADGSELVVAQMPKLAAVLPHHRSTPSGSSQRLPARFGQPYGGGLRETVKQRTPVAERPVATHPPFSAHAWNCGIWLPH
jgi:hypothetical protein